jgi:hypothetical protein
MNSFCSAYFAEYHIAYTEKNNMLNYKFQIGTASDVWQQFQQ